MPKSTGSLAIRSCAVALALCLSLWGRRGLAQEPEAGQPDEPAAPAEAAPAAAAEPEPASDAAQPQEEPSTIPVAEAPEPGPESGSVELEDVVVTATKREKSLREIAGSIGEFNGARLEDEGKLSLVDYLEQKPGITLTSLGPGLVKVNVRGIASDAYFGAPLPSPTGMFIGDTAFGDPFITNVQPDMSAFDLSRVEILKGPQGTLFGGSALAGAVRYVMQDPVFGEWQARSFAQYDAPNGGTAVWSEGVTLNAPLLTDSLAVRLGFVNRDYSGITDNTYLGTKDIDHSAGEQLRGIVSWQPLDNLGIKLTHLEQDSFTENAVVIADSAEGPRETRMKALPQPSIQDFAMDSLEVGYDFDDMRLVALTSRTEKNWWINVDISYVITGPPDETFTREEGTFQITDDRSDSVSQELRLQSTGKDGLQWLAGLYNVDYEVFFEILDDSVGNYELHQQLGTDPEAYYETTLLYAVTNIEAYERAAFAELSYRFWDRLELSAGARVYETQVKGGYVGRGALARQANGGQNFDYSDNELTEKGVNPKFSATYEFTRDLSVFALASKGYRFGGVQTVPSKPCTGDPPPADCNNVPPDYDSDTIWNYELGARTSWLDNTLHFDATLFYIDYDKPQVVLRTNNASGFNLAYTDNVDSAISQGFEAALAWLTPLEGLKLDVSGGITDSHTTAPFTAASPYVSGGCGCEVIPSGSWMPGVARYQYMAGLNYGAPPIGIFDLNARVDYTYIGEGVGTLLQERPINDYGTLNAGITLSTNAARWLRPKLAFNVSNILDVTAPKLGYDVKPVENSEGLIDVWYLNPPRTYSLRLGLEF